MSIIPWPGDVNVEGPAGRIFTCTIITTTFLLLAFYTSVFISSLTVPLIKLPFLDVEGLLKDGTYKLGITKGHSDVEKFRVRRNVLNWEGGREGDEEGMS